MFRNVKTCTQKQERGGKHRYVKEIFGKKEQRHKHTFKQIKKKEKKKRKIKRYSEKYIDKKQTKRYRYTDTIKNINRGTYMEKLQTK